MTYPTPGEPAPSFRLQNQRGEWVSSDDFRGRYLVLYFYPKALTPGCTTQACGIRDSRAELAELDTVVLGVSPDPVSLLAKFVDKHVLNFDLLADEGHELAEKYGVWGQKSFMGKQFMGVLRTTFVIGPDGRLAAVLDQFKTGSHHEDLLKLILKLRK